jgi:Ion channel
MGLSIRNTSAAGNGEIRTPLRAWQDRIRDPMLTLLLALVLCADFIAEPLAARGLPIARTIADALVLVLLAMLVLLSQRPEAMISILLALAAIIASLAFGKQWPPIAGTLLRRGGGIVAFSALAWVVGHAVYAPGRITYHRLQGAVVVYLSFAAIFASAYGVIWELMPGAFGSLQTVTIGDDAEAVVLMYFSLTTLTTTGYGDIVAVDPFVRSLANLEALIGVFYVAITVARLVTLELEDRRR